MTMILLYVSIPFMVAALAIATVPLAWAMRREHREHRLQHGTGAVDGRAVDRGSPQASSGAGAGAPARNHSTVRR